MKFKSLGVAYIRGFMVVHEWGSSHLNSTWGHGHILKSTCDI